MESVHNLHLWSLTMNQTILSAHVATGQYISVKRKYSAAAWQRSVTSDRDTTDGIAGAC